MYVFIRSNLTVKIVDILRLYQPCMLNEPLTESASAKPNNWYFVMVTPK